MILDADPVEMVRLVLDHLSQEAMVGFLGDPVSVLILIYDGN